MNVLIGLNEGTYVRLSYRVMFCKRIRKNYPEKLPFSELPSIVSKSFTSCLAQSAMERKRENVSTLVNYSSSKDVGAAATRFEHFWFRTVTILYIKSIVISVDQVVFYSPQQFYYIFFT